MSALDLFAETLTLSARTAPRAPTYQPSGLQERAARFGCQTLADFEALELLLSRTAPKLAGNHAKALLQRYSSLGAVLAVPSQALAQMVGSAAALDLKLIRYEQMVARPQAREGRSPKDRNLANGADQAAHRRSTGQHRGHPVFNRDHARRAGQAWRT
ncbi:hypothetical protein [Phenylobacterium sp.]|jgi:hypothetical protein|uniref:hypothetical protein n=1 Tax=Phenylobacterium sp. TaxID=1871053 RepID=UPI0037CA0B27